MTPQPSSRFETKINNEGKGCKGHRAGFVQTPPNSHRATSPISVLSPLREFLTASRMAIPAPYTRINAMPRRHRHNLSLPPMPLRHFKSRESSQEKPGIRLSIFLIFIQGTYYLIQSLFWCLYGIDNAWEITKGVCATSNLRTRSLLLPTIPQVPISESAREC